ncbi:hypothetical protein F7725_015189 [Dissostichus mawsoni]|uniref:Uncharacterized protein n=1 Tax=Dissostichus mawsoni TaxID=36200 RepID=A0A7J5YGQ5_DISMA|nr:hypothetical protein F7725_015189 [Dissostichus mawsoni]
MGGDTGRGHFAPWESSACLLSLAHIIQEVERITSSETQRFRTDHKTTHSEVPGPSTGLGAEGVTGLPGVRGGLGSWKVEGGDGGERGNGAVGLEYQETHLKGTDVDESFGQLHDVVVAQVQSA